MNKKTWMSLAAVACVACCSLPFLPVAILSVGGLSVIALDVWLCVGVLLVAALVWWRIVRLRAVVTCQQAAVCKMDCDCRNSAIKTPDI